MIYRSQINFQYSNPIRRSTLATSIKKIVILTFATVVYGFSHAQSDQNTGNTSIANATMLSDDNIELIYWSRAQEPIPYENFAYNVSEEYRQANNEFTRGDALQRAIPIVDARLSAVRDVERVYINVRHRLAEYDFDRGGFPSNLSEGTYIPFSSGYRVRYSNAEDFLFFPMSQDDARSALSEAPSRSVTKRVEGTIVSVEPGWRGEPYIVVRLEKVELRHSSGEIFASLEVQ